MFELSASYMDASWWMVDSCMPRIGEQRMFPGLSEHKLCECLLEDGEFVQWRKLVNKECFRASLCSSDTSYLSALGGSWICGKTGPIIIDSVLAFLCRAVDHGPCPKMPKQGR